MRRFLITVLTALVAISLMGCELSDTEKSRSATLAKNAEDIYSTSAKAISTISAPEIDFFVERDTIARWAERWDKPSIVTYLYLFSYGNCIGYYVCNGKPAATTNYLVPEYQNVYKKGIGTYVQEQTMDLDGTYGANNPGIRFFTASGIAVEWAGGGASYLYSDAPLPINVPKLGE